MSETNCYTCESNISVTIVLMYRNSNFQCVTKEIRKYYYMLSAYSDPLPLKDQLPVTQGPLTGGPHCRM